MFANRDSQDYISVACILTKSDFPLERADRILARAIEIDCNRLTAAHERGPEVIAMESNRLLDEKLMRKSLNSNKMVPMIT